MSWSFVSTLSCLLVQPAISSIGISERGVRRAAREYVNKIF